MTPTKDELATFLICAAAVFGMIYYVLRVIVFVKQLLRGDHDERERAELRKELEAVKERVTSLERVGLVNEAARTQKLNSKMDAILERFETLFERRNNK